MIREALLTRAFLLHFQLGGSLGDAGLAQILNKAFKAVRQPHLHAAFSCCGNVERIVIKK